MSLVWAFWLDRTHSLFYLSKVWSRWRFPLQLFPFSLHLTDHLTSPVANTPFEMHTKSFCDNGSMKLSSNVSIMVLTLCSSCSILLGLKSWCWLSFTVFARDVLKTIPDTCSVRCVDSPAMHSGFMLKFVVPPGAFVSLFTVVSIILSASIWPNELLEDN